MEENLEEYEDHNYEAAPIPGKDIDSDQKLSSNKSSAKTIVGEFPNTKFDTIEKKMEWLVFMNTFNVRKHAI